MIIGAAKIAWFHGSGDDVSIAAAMKMIRIAYLNCRSRKPAVTRPIRARKKTAVGISKTKPIASIIFTYMANTGEIVGMNTM